MVDGIHENLENWAPTKYNDSTVSIYSTDQSKVKRGDGKSLIAIYFDSKCFDSQFFNSNDFDSKCFDSKFLYPPQRS